MIVDEDMVKENKLSELNDSGQVISEAVEKLVLAMDLAKLVQWEYDFSKDVFIFNDAFYSLYGTTVEREGGYEMASKKYAQDFVYPDDQYMVNDEIKKAVASSDPKYISQLIHRITRRDGEIRTMMVRFGLKRDSQSMPKLLYGVNQDVTDREKEKKQLEVETEKFKNIFEFAPDAMYTYDLMGTFLDGNKASEELTGYGKEELIGTSFLKKGILKGSDLISAGEDLALSVLGKPTNRVIYNIHRKDGSTRLAETRSFPTTINGEKIVLGVARDVTEEKKLDLELKKFKQGIERSDDVVFMTDENGVFTYSNFAFSEMYGWEFEEIKMSTPRILKSGKQTQQFYEEFWNTLKKGSVVSTKVINKKKDGNLVTMTVTASPIIDDDKQVVGFLAIQRDVTKQEETDVVLAERVMELEKLNKVMIGREVRMVELKQENELLKQRNA